jgi:hypothetical protein
MEAPGNAWLEAWEAAKPVPARRQRRLFDDTREAEKALQFWSMLTPGDVAQALAPVLFHAAAIRVSEEATAPQATLASAWSALSRLSRWPCAAEVRHYAAGNGAAFEEDFHKRFQAMEEVSSCAVIFPIFVILLTIKFNFRFQVVANLTTCEAKVSQALSLRFKFLGESERDGDALGSRGREVVDAASPNDRDGVSKHTADFVNDLCNQRPGAEVAVLGAARGPAGRLIRRMFLEAKKAKKSLVADEVQKLHTFSSL